MTTLDFIIKLLSYEAFEFFSGINLLSSFVDAIISLVIDVVS